MHSAILRAFLLNTMRWKLSTLSISFLAQPYLYNKQKYVMQKFSDFPLAHKQNGKEKGKQKGRAREEISQRVWLKRFGDAVNDDGNGK